MKQAADAKMMRLAAGMSPSARRIMLTVCAMTATIMQALDTTVANVALPYMQGSLSASLDQINWVLTSYIVASAIMTAPIGWMSDRYGRKAAVHRLLPRASPSLRCCARCRRTSASMVFARLLQGAFGAALVPLSQSVMLDAYPAEQRGQAMAIWGMGVMLGPILGPTLGGFLTDQYSLALGVPDQPAGRHRHRARPDACSWTRPRSRPSCASTGSASSRSPSASARCN